MDNDDRLVPKTVFEQGETGPEPVDIGKALFVAPFARARTGIKRSKDELVESLHHVEANSPEEVFEAFDVRLTGQFEDGDETVDVSMPVRSADDVTPNGMVRGIPRLLSLYVGSSTGDAVASELAGRNRELLSDAETRALEAVASDLERSLEAEES